MMNNRTRHPHAESEQLPSELVELGRCIARLSAADQLQLEDAYSRVVESVRRRRRILTLVQEALSQLRLDIKYLMFDLEVTRQERDELRQKLEEN